MSDVTSQKSNKTASGGAVGGTTSNIPNSGGNPNLAGARPAPAAQPAEQINTEDPNAHLKAAGSGVAFHSANIAPKQDIFAEQNQINAEKKAQADAKRKKILRIVFITAGIIVAILLAWLIIWLITHLAYNSDITNPDKNEQGQAIGVTKADEILEKNDGNMDKVQEYFDQQIDKEGNTEKKNEIVVMAMEYYIEAADWERAIKASELAEVDKMTQGQLAKYTLMLFNSYISIDDPDKAFYWNDYYNELYPETIELEDSDGETMEEAE